MNDIEKKILGLKAAIMSLVYWKDARKTIVGNWHAACDSVQIPDGYTVDGKPRRYLLVGG